MHTELLVVFQSCSFARKSHKFIFRIKNEIDTDIHSSMVIYFIRLWAYKIFNTFRWVIVVTLTVMRRYFLKIFKKFYSFHLKTSRNFVVNCFLVIIFACSYFQSHTCVLPVVIGLNHHVLLLCHFS